jgi:hypothetical protein
LPEARINDSVQRTATLLAGLTKVGSGAYTIDCLVRAPLRNACSLAGSIDTGGRLHCGQRQPDRVCGVQWLPSRVFRRGLALGKERRFPPRHQVHVRLPRRGQCGHEQEHRVPQGCAHVRRAVPVQRVRQDHHPVRHCGGEQEADFLRACHPVCARDGTSQAAWSTAGPCIVFVPASCA